MINYTQFKENIVIPVLQKLEPAIPFTANAVDLVMMTIAHESLGGKYLRQMGNGPARGVAQMEVVTHDDIWENYLTYRGELADRVKQFMFEGIDGADQLMSNLAYAVAMCRVHYYRAPAPLPKSGIEGYLEALGEYAKLHYNTAGGKATPEEYVEDYLKWRG